MIRRMRLFYVCATVFLFISGVAGCYSRIPRDSALSFPSAPDRLGRLLLVIQEKNSAIQSFKGIGRIQLRGAGGTRTSRAAWLGAADGRLRIEFLGLPGQSVARVVFDGSHLLFSPVTDPDIFQKKSNDPDLKPAVGVSIRASEVITLLAGGVPVYAYDSVSLETSESSGLETLVFRKRWLGVVEKIFFRETAIEKVEVFRWGNTIYQATLNDVRPVDGRSVPFSLAIEDPDGRGFSFSVDRQWTGVDLTPAMFDIAPAE